MTDIDKELAAMKRIANALQSLDHTGHQRVMRWIIDVYEKSLETKEPDDLELTARAKDKK